MTSSLADPQITAQWPHAPVVVVGAGPVGQTAALLLARWNVPSIVLDQRDERDHTGSKAICQQRDVLDVWEAVGVGRRIADEGVTWTTARTFHGNRELFHRTFGESEKASFPPFVNLSQSRTEAILDEAVNAQPLIDVRWGVRVDGFDQDDAGASVRCASGDVIRTPFVLMCTGARSTELRAALGTTLAGRSFDDRFLICDIRAELAQGAAERRFYFDPPWNPGRQVLIHPCPDSTYRIDWQVPADFDSDHEQRTGALDRRIRHVTGDVDYELIWSSVYRFHSRCVDRMRNGRILLVGDSAHLLSPFGGRGLNSGVADAENAAWKVAYAGFGWAPLNVLETYHDERRGAALENLAVTSATMDFLVPPDAEKAAYREDVLSRAHDKPEMRSRVDSGRLSEPFWYPDSALTTPDPTRPRPTRPRIGQPQTAAPGALLCDASVVVGGVSTWLRRVSRSGLLLLTGSQAEVTVLPVDVGPVKVLEIDAIDSDGALTAALNPRPDEVWIIRPDAHIAAVVRPDEVPDALRRVTGQDVGLTS